jgi:hypothetical protein
MTTQKYNCLLLYAYYVIQHMATPKGKIAKLQQKAVKTISISAAVVLSSKKL